MGILRPKSSAKDRLALLIDEYNSYEQVFKRMKDEEDLKNYQIKTSRAEILNLETQYSYKAKNKEKEHFTQESIDDLRELIISKQKELEISENLLKEILERKDRAQKEMLLLMPEIGKLQREIGPEESIK
jgi:hypothetical protein